MNRDTLKTQIDALADSIQAVKDKGPSIQETLTKHASRAQAKALSGSLTGKDLTFASLKRLGKYAVNNPGEILLGGVAIAMFDIEDIS
jgi:hypothetical protein